MLYLRQIIRGTFAVGVLFLLISCFQNCSNGFQSTSSQASGQSAGTGNPSTPVPGVDCTHDVWNNLEACGWAGPGNTGPDMSQCPNGLKAVGASQTSTITITVANTIINCQKITGGLQIAAQNVTIKNSIISYDGGGAGGSGVININDGASATIDHVDIDGLNHTHSCIWNEGVKGAALPYSMVAKNVNCHNVNDGIFSWWWSNDAHAEAGSDFIIQDSYFHDFTENAANGHIDGYQTEGAQNGVINHNTYKMTRTPNDIDVAGGGMDSAIAIWNDFNQSSPTGLLATNFQISNNLIGGGGFAVYAEDTSPSEGVGGASGGNQLTNVIFTNNKFSTAIEGKCVGFYGVWFYRPTWTPYFGGPSDGWHRTGNMILETGINVDSGNPSGCN
jgi:hypothetical protein